MALDLCGLCVCFALLEVIVIVYGICVFNFRNRVHVGVGMCQEPHCTGLRYQIIDYQLRVIRL